VTNKEKVCNICHQTREYCSNFMTEQEPAPTDLLPCPFCGSIDLKIVGVAAEDDPDFEYARAVMCMICYARGRHNYPIGWAESDRAASEAWNEREAQPDSSSVSTF
jgi:Lar family restriction alleviation protein